MSPWDGASRWINTLLLVVVGIIGFDTLFRLLEANEANVIVAFTRNGAAFLLQPFDGMFAADEYLLTSLIAILAYALLAGVALAVVRAVQASTQRRQAAAGTHSRAVHANDRARTTSADGSSDVGSTPEEAPAEPHDGPSPGDSRPREEATPRLSNGSSEQRRT